MEKGYFQSTQSFQMSPRGSIFLPTGVKKKCLVRGGISPWGGIVHLFQCYEYLM